MNDPHESNLSQTENGGNRESSNSLGVIKRDNILLILEIIVLVVMVFSLIAAVLLVPENKIHIFWKILFYFISACLLVIGIYFFRRKRIFWGVLGISSSVLIIIIGTCLFFPSIKYCQICKRGPCPDCAPCPNCTPCPDCTPCPTNSPLPTYTFPPTYTPIPYKTHTQYPSYTPYPTYTFYPTYTPYPTYTLFSTHTPSPSVTPKPTKIPILFFDEFNREKLSSDWYPHNCGNNPITLSNGLMHMDLSQATPNSKNECAISPRIDNLYTSTSMEFESIFSNIPEASGASIWINCAENYFIITYHHDFASISGIAGNKKVDEFQYFPVKRKIVLNFLDKNGINIMIYDSSGNEIYSEAFPSTCQPNKINYYLYTNNSVEGTKFESDYILVK